MITHHLPHDPAHQHRSRTHRLGRWCAAIAGAALASTMLVAPAHAGSFGDDAFGKSFPGLNQPCDQEAFGKYVCSPDFVATASAQWTYPTVRNGQRVSFFYVSVQNTALSSTDTLFTTVGIDDGEIVEIEQWFGDGATAAPIAESDGDGLWVIEHDNGLAKNETTGFRVWVAGWDTVDFTVETNRHIGIDSLGTPGSKTYIQREVTRSNNTATGTL